MKLLPLVCWGPLVHCQATPSPHPPSPGCWATGSSEHTHSLWGFSSQILRVVLNELSLKPPKMVQNKETKAEGVINCFLLKKQKTKKKNPEEILKCIPNCGTLALAHTHRSYGCAEREASHLSEFHLSSDSLRARSQHCFLGTAGELLASHSVKQHLPRVMTSQKPSMII